MSQPSHPLFTVHWYQQFLERFLKSWYFLISYSVFLNGFWPSLNHFPTAENSWEGLRGEFFKLFYIKEASNCLLVYGFFPEDDIKPLLLSVSSGMICLPYFQNVKFFYFFNKSGVITQLYIIHLTEIKQDIKNLLPVIS